VNKTAGGTLNVGDGRGRLLSGVNGLKLGGLRHERQIVAMHGGKPQELELREENERRRDRSWNRLAMQISHGELATKNTLIMPNRLAKPIKLLGLVLLMLD